MAITDNNMALKKLQKSMVLHRETLLVFQRWLETTLQPAQLLYENLITVEKLIEHSPPSEKYHRMGPLILAVQCARVVRFYRHLSTIRGFPGVSKLEKDPFKIMYMLVGSMDRAAKECLLANDHSMVAEKKKEYANMSDQDRLSLQHEQHTRIIEFFNSAQEHHFVPKPELVKSIMNRILQVDPKYSKLRKQRRVTFSSTPRSSKGKSSKAGLASHEDELLCQLQALAREQANLIELIEENAELLKCFYVKESKVLLFRSPEHREPSRILKYLSDKIWDITWETFCSEIGEVEAHQRFVARLKTRRLFEKVSESELEELQERYKDLEENEKCYVSYLIRCCEEGSGEIVRRLNQPNTCSAPEGIFHFKMVNSSSRN